MTIIDISKILTEKQRKKLLRIAFLVMAICWIFSIESVHQRYNNIYILGIYVWISGAMILLINTLADRNK